MNKNDYLVKAFECLGEVIAHKDGEISILKYEIDNLKEKIEHLESYIGEK